MEKRQTSHGTEQEINLDFQNIKFREIDVVFVQLVCTFGIGGVVPACLTCKNNFGGKGPSVRLSQRTARLGLYGYST